MHPVTSSSFDPPPAQHRLKKPWNWSNSIANELLCEPIGSPAARDGAVSAVARRPGISPKRSSPRTRRLHPTAPEKRTNSTATASFNLIEEGSTVKETAAAVNEDVEDEIEESNAVQAATVTTRGGSTAANQIPAREDKRALPPPAALSVVARPVTPRIGWTPPAQ
ncbi:unnamed protein product [Urochloa humidicola]